MEQILMINSVMGWERKLKLAEERQKNHRSDPYVNYLAAPQSCRQERNHPDEDQLLADFVHAPYYNL